MMMLLRVCSATWLFKWCRLRVVGVLVDGLSYLDETDVGALLAEALTADVEAILADETSRVGADAAVGTLLATDLPNVSLVSSSAIFKRNASPPVSVCFFSIWAITYHSREPLP
jgi:hypothetical protein